MRNLRTIAGAFLLTLALALVGCGQADINQDGNASLTITSVPQAEVFVDGVSQGTGSQTLTLASGEHKVAFKAEGFKTFETTVTINGGETQPVEALLEPLDPSSPIVVASLMQSEGLEVAPWVAPEITRGSSKQSVAVLLWPSKDVRHDGLVNFAIEAGETYEGDASLEFRSGRKVLFREKFSPESITSVRPIPAEVLEHVKVNSKITWGLYFEDRRRPIKTTFKIVNRPKAERQLERLRKSRHMQRQPAITRRIAAAVVLENNRLYSEALVANLQVANDHPQSSQPFRGIITTLRRLEAENSELFATISPHVSGKGAAGGISARGRGLGISAWSPVQEGALPTPTATPDSDATDSGTARPHAQGLTPTGGADRPADGTEPTADAPGGTVVGPDHSPAHAEALSRRMTELTAEADEANARATDAEAAAEQANAHAQSAEAAADGAEADAAAARAAVENATDPTPEQHARVHETGQAAEEAREQAAAAQQAAGDAARALAGVREQAAGINSQIADLKKLLDAANGVNPDANTAEAIPGAAPEPTAPSLSDLQDALNSVQQAHSDAMTRVESAETALTAAEQAHTATPNAATQAALDAALQERDSARASAEDVSRELEGAERAVYEYAPPKSEPKPAVPGAKPVVPSGESKDK